MVYEPMLRLYTEFSLKKHAFVMLNFFLKTTVIYIKKEVLFLFSTVYLSFLNSETSLNFSFFICEIFVKTQNFDSYDVIMM